MKLKRRAQHNLWVREFNGLNRTTNLILIGLGFGWGAVPQWELEDGRIHASELESQDSMELEEDWDFDNLEIGAWKSRNVVRLDTLGHGSVKNWRVHGAPTSWIWGEVEGDSILKRVYGVGRYSDGWGYAEAWWGKWRWSQMGVLWPWPSGLGGALKSSYQKWILGVGGIQDSLGIQSVHLWTAFKQGQLAVSGSPESWGWGIAWGQDHNGIRLWMDQDHPQFQVSTKIHRDLAKGLFESRTDLLWVSSKIILLKSKLKWTKESWQMNSQLRMAQVQDSTDVVEDELRYAIELGQNKKRSHWRAEVRGLWPSASHQGVVSRMEAALATPLAPWMLGAWEWKCGDPYSKMGLESGLQWKSQESLVSWVIRLPRSRKNRNDFQWRSQFQREWPWGSLGGHWTVKNRRTSQGEMRLTLKLGRTQRRK